MIHLKIKKKQLINVCFYSQDSCNSSSADISELYFFSWFSSCSNLEAFLHSQQRCSSLPYFHLETSFISIPSCASKSYQRSNVALHFVHFTGSTHSWFLILIIVRFYLNTYNEFENTFYSSIDFI